MTEKNQETVGKNFTFLHILPAAVLSGGCVCLYLALSTFSPFLTRTAAFEEHTYPAVTVIISFLNRSPFLFAFSLFILGGISFFLFPECHPLHLTAWYLAAVFITGLWITFIVLIPYTAFTDHYPLL